MIDREHDLSITKQAEVLKISRSSVYYLPRPVPAADLALMRRLDRLHLEFPFGLVNGAVNAAGLPGDMLTGFGNFPNNYVPNLFRRMHGFPPIPADQPDDFKSWTSDELRHSLENFFGEFYQPKSRAGRYAETIGEMAPMVFGGEGLGVLFGAQKLVPAIRALPSTLAKHAVAPGIVVQALDEALPDSSAGKNLQKAYPVLRRVVPAALAARRYLNGRVVP
jgi:hypothetical protein